MSATVDVVNPAGSMDLVCATVSTMETMVVMVGATG